MDQPLDPAPIDRDEVIRAAVASLAEAQARIESVLSIGIDVVGDQELIKAGVSLRVAEDALNTLLTLDGFGPDSRG